METLSKNSNVFLTQLIFYFLVYGLLYLKFNVRERNKNKNTILFEQFFFLDSRFSMSKDGKK